MHFFSHQGILLVLNALILVAALAINEFFTKLLAHSEWGAKGAFAYALGTTLLALGVSWVAMRTMKIKASRIEDAVGNTA